MVFDGDCAFCSTSVRWAQRRIRRLPHFVPYQHADLDAYGLTEAACRDAVQWVGADGATAAGHRAVSALLRHGGRGWRVLGVVIDVPGVRLISAALYRWVAAHRHQLPGGTAACAARPAASAVDPGR